MAKGRARTVFHTLAYAGDLSIVLFARWISKADEAASKQPTYTICRLYRRSRFSSSGATLSLTICALRDEKALSGQVGE